MRGERIIYTAPQHLILLREGDCEHIPRARPPTI